MSTLQQPPTHTAPVPGGRVLLRGGVLAGATADEDGGSSASAAAPTALVLDGSTVAWGLTSNGTMTA